jgi:hypothetical protein
MLSAEMPLKNDDRLNIRVPGDLLATLDEIQKKHGLSATEIARRCLEGVAEFYRENGYFAFPVKIQPGDVWAKIHQQTSANLTGIEKEKAKAGETARAKATGKKAG